MVKITVFVLIALSVLMLKGSFGADPKDTQKITAITQECKVSENATDTDVSKLKTASPGSVKSTTIKCLSTCISEKMGIININNRQLNADGVLKLLKTAPNVTENINVSVNEIVNECKNIQHPDRCEYGSKIMDCINDGGIKRGIKYVL